MDPQNQLFDPRLRRLRRARAAHGGGAGYLVRRATDELAERLDLVSRPFPSAMALGPHSADLAGRLRGRGLEIVEADEDGLPFPDRSFDLIVSIGLIDTINDLPGALTLIRRALRPDGLFLAAFVGAGSLPRLKRAMRAADEAEGTGASPRIHPQIDVRAAGDLMLRAGFALPVVDRDVFEVRYGALMDLVGDLRAMGATNSLAGEKAWIGRRGLAAAIADFEAHGDSVERFEIVHLSGWAPA